MNDVSLIRKNLFRRKFRTIMLLIAIFIAFLIYGVLSSFEKAFNAGIELSASDRLVTVNKINFTQTLPLAYANRVSSVEGIKRVSHVSWFGGYHQEPKNFIVVFAIQDDRWLDIFPELLLSEETRAAFRRDRKGALVGRKLAEKQGWQIGDKIPLSSNIYSKEDGSHVWDMNIVGIFDGNKTQVDTNYMVFHYEYFNEARTFDKDMIGWLAIQTRNPGENDAVMSKVDALFANSPHETRTTTESAFNKAFLEQIGSINLIVNSVVSAAFATILMIVGNTMYLAVGERTKEIAVLKTLGFRSRRIFGMILSESLLLSLLGGIPALFVTYGIISAIVPMLSSTLPSLSLSTEVVVTALAWMLLLGVITGLLPAYNAMRLNIQTALGRGQ